MKKLYCYAEMTNALRLRGVRLRQVRSRKDEVEPLIRLADMWAGCVRAARLGRTTEKRLLAQAVKQGYLWAGPNATATQR